MDGFAHRLIFTQMWRLGVTGLLYWSTTYWNPDPNSGAANPWEDMATVKDINPSIYGDGSLLYPGQQVGIDGLRTASGRPRATLSLPKGAKNPAS